MTPAALMIMAAEISSGNRPGMMVVDAASRRCAGQLSTMQLDPVPGLSPDAALAWRNWIGGAMRSLAEGQTELPPRPDADDDGVARRLARQIELMAGAMRRLGG